MTIDVKICGINDTTGLQAAVKAGASYVGFVFYPPSPRAIPMVAAHKLSETVPAHIVTVGLFVDPKDDELIQVVRDVPMLGMIQLHGKETPVRVGAIRLLTGRPVMKAIGIATAKDFEQVKDYAIADQLLFDARPQPGAMPGGTATSFDWTLLKNRAFEKPWLLAGGLNAQNLAEAVKKSGARAVDVSSGVEDKPGHKDPDKIRTFMDMAKRL